MAAEPRIPRPEPFPIQFSKNPAAPASLVPRSSNAVPDRCRSIPHSSRRAISSSSRIPSKQRDASSSLRSVPHSSRPAKTSPRGIPSSMSHPEEGERGSQSSSHHAHHRERPRISGECLIPRSSRPAHRGECSKNSGEQDSKSASDFSERAQSPSPETLDRSIRRHYYMYIMKSCPAPSPVRKRSAVDGSGSLTNDVPEGPEHGAAPSGPP
jgi:hypothetical protein